jgi:glyoxylate reductase
MARVVLTAVLPQPAPSMLEAVAEVAVVDPARLADELADADVACVQLRDRIDGSLLRAATRLRAVCNYAVGYDNIDVEAASRLGIFVANTPDVLTSATADCAMGLVLAAARRLREGDALMRRGEFTGWRPDFLLGLDLNGATLAVVGFGRIGRALAVRAKAFGMQILYVTRTPCQLPPELADARSSTLAEALAEADVISLHVPLTASTHHLIDEAALRSMKPTAVLINTARGAVIDEAALVRALQQGWIAAAGLDVYEHEPLMAPGLAACENAVLAPHLGSATTATRAAMAELCARNAVAAIAGEVPPNAVNATAAAARPRART